MRKERELLTEIAAISDLETAEKAAERYSPEKHPYSFDGYIYQLEKLKAILLAGIPAKAAFELVDSCIDTQVVLDFIGEIT